MSAPGGIVWAMLVLTGERCEVTRQIKVETNCDRCGALAVFAMEVVTPTAVDWALHDAGWTGAQEGKDICPACRPTYESARA